MRTSWKHAWVAAGLALVLAACGTTSPTHFTQPASAPANDDPLRPEQYGYKEARPPDLLSLAGQAPITHLDASRSRWNRRVLNGSWHVGGDVAPLTGETRGCHEQSLARRCGAPNHVLPTIRNHAGTAVSHGTLRDGVGRAKVVKYLKTMASFWGSEGGLFTLDTAPVVRLAEGTSYEHQQYVVRAVQILNSALPHGWKIRIDDRPVPARFRERGLSPGRGEIVVEFASLSGPQAAGTYLPRWQGTRHVGGDVLFDPYLAWKNVRARHNHELASTKLDQEQATVGLLVHEIIHGLGGGHVTEGVNNCCGVPKSNMGKSHDIFGTPGHILYMWDREALLAAYSRVAPGTRSGNIAKSFGSWADTSLHVKGTFRIPGGEVAFGAAHRNGFVAPWANGPTPSAYLAGNLAPTGSARWTGRVLGLTPNAEAVAGAAALTVQLERLEGDLDFTALESWPAHAAPGAISTGTRWRSGRLHYDINVRGNTFVQTGGDVGKVTGVFFGRSHEAMGGVLERPDLSAGFGGKMAEPAALLNEVGSFTQYYGPSWGEWIGPYSQWMPPPEFRSFLSPAQRQEWDAAAADCTAEVQTCIDTFGGPADKPAIAAWKAAIEAWEAEATEAWLTHKTAREAYRFFDAWGFKASIGDKTLFSAVIDGTMHNGCDTLAPWEAAAAECAPLLGFDVTIEGTPTGYNPAVGSAVWNGDARGVDSRGYPIEEASVRLEADLEAATIDARLSHFERHIFSWRGLALTNGAFSQGDAFKHYQDGGAAETAPSEWSIDGAFYGDDHQSAAGMWTEPSGAFGVFGALREQSEPVAKLEAEDWGYWATLDGDTLFLARLNDRSSAAECLVPWCLGWDATVGGNESGVNPTIGSATWSGYALAGSVGSDRFMEGQARLEADLSAATIDVHLTELGWASHSWTGMSMSDGAFGSEDDLASIEGAFYGAEHQGAAGSFEVDSGAGENAVGVFGALREPR